MRLLPLLLTGCQYGVVPFEGETGLSDTDGPLGSNTACQLVEGSVAIVATTDAVALWTPQRERIFVHNWSVARVAGQRPAVSAAPGRFALAWPGEDGLGHVISARADGIEWFGSTADPTPRVFIGATGVLLIDAEDGDVLRDEAGVERPLPEGSWTGLVGSGWAAGVVDGELFWQHPDGRTHDESERAVDNRFGVRRDGVVFTDSEGRWAIALPDPPVTRGVYFGADQPLKYFVPRHGGVVTALTFTDGSGPPEYAWHRLPQEAGGSMTDTETVDSMPRPGAPTTGYPVPVLSILGETLFWLAADGPDIQLYTASVGSDDWMARGNPMRAETALAHAAGDTILIHTATTQVVPDQGSPWVLAPAPEPIARLSPTGLCMAWTRDAGSPEAEVVIADTRTGEVVSREPGDFVTWWRTTGN